MIIPVKHLALIAAVLAALFAINYALSKAYYQGVNFQTALQDKTDALYSDLRNADKERIEDDATRRIALAVAAAANADDLNSRLRGQLDEIKRIASNASGTFAPGTSARDAVLLLADLLRQCSERYGQMAEFADTAHNAGKTCEQQYDSLKKVSPR